MKWFDEFMATFFGQGYLWHKEGMDADPLQAGLIPDSLAEYRTLEDFERYYPSQFLSAEGFANYAWYQLQFAARARAVFGKQGLDFIRRVREKLPWDHYATWQTNDLLQWLEAIEPGFVAWAANMSHGRK